MKAFLLRIIVDDEARLEQVQEVVWDALDNFCTSHDEEHCPMSSQSSRCVRVNTTNDGGVVLAHGARR